MDNIINAEIRKNVKKINFYLKRIFIFGANGYCACIIDALKELDIVVEKIVDNDKKKQGSYVEGIEVVLPEKYLLPFIDNAVVLIASKYFDEMSRQLEIYGYKEKVFCVLKIFGPNPPKNCHCTLNELYGVFDKIKNGAEILIEIKEQYGEDVFMLYIPISAIGDTYLLSMFFHAYLSKEGIEKYVFVVTSEVLLRMIKNIGFPNVFVINRIESECITRYLELYGFEKNRVKILTYDSVRTQVVTGMFLKENINMLDSYRIWLGLAENQKKDLPALNYHNKDLQKILQLYKIEKSNTVILAPNANTIKWIDLRFWEELGKQLSGRGYKVVTNISKDHEKVVPGTVPIMFDLELANPILEYAGYFIGVRSGFCDVICNADCRKIILYPNIAIEEIGEVYNATSFKRMGIGKNMYEIIFEVESNYMDLIDKVLNLVKERL